MRWAMVACCCLASWATLVTAEESTRSLASAVEQFNREAQSDTIGKRQPALTEAEIVAAIRGWIREQIPVSDEIYLTYQKIAETKQLPKDATLSFTTRWTGYRAYDFNVWWVDLEVMTGPNSGYGFRIRDQKISSEPVPKNGPAKQAP